MTRSTAFTLITALIATITLNACSPMGAATGAGAVVGVSAAQEGGIDNAISDAHIAATINDLWFKYDLSTFTKLNLTVDQGRVLITGIVQDPQHRVEAVRLAWQAKGVRQVINEVQIAESTGLSGYAKDVWISTRLRTAITLDRDISSLNYSIDTVQYVVYLMGVAENQEELNQVIEHARVVPNVKRVVSYVKLAGEPLENTQDYVAAP